MTNGEALFAQDLHVHTNFSWCAAEEMSLDAIATRAQELGLRMVGLADHLWLDRRRGCRPAVSHLLRLREQLKRVRTPVRMWLGAEADCAPHRGLAGNGQLHELDFVIASYHFSDVREGAAPWPRSAEELAMRLLDGFRSLVQAPKVTVAGHPFFIPPRIYRRLPAAVHAHLEETFELLEREAGPWFDRAAQRGIAIELNARALGPLHRPALLPLFKLAKERRCAFVVSSDAHRLQELGQGRLLADYLGKVGVTPDDLLAVGETARVPA